MSLILVSFDQVLFIIIDKIINTYHREGSAQKRWTRCDVTEEKIALTTVHHCSISDTMVEKAQITF